MWAGGWGKPWEAGWRASGPFLPRVIGQDYKAPAKAHTLL